MTLLAADPVAVVQRQLDAYNAHDLESFVAIYADDAELFAHSDSLLAKGSAEIRARYAARFSNDKPLAAVVNRIILGATVIDEEEITVSTADAKRVIKAIAIYEVREGRIARAWFIA